jgi:hypothetical protein
LTRAAREIAGDARTLELVVLAWMRDNARVWPDPVIEKINEANRQS